MAKMPKVLYKRGKGMQGIVNSKMYIYLHNRI